MIDEILPHEAHERINSGSWIYLDVRSVQEFEEGHPVGAYNVPLLFLTPEGMIPNPRFLAVVKATFPTSTPIVLGCRSGRRSMTAANQLTDHGYIRLVNLRTGFGGKRDPFGQILEKGWKSEKLPTAYAAAPGRSYETLSATNSMD